MGSVSALLRVRQGTVSLKHRVVELNEEVQKSGGGVADKVRPERGWVPVQLLTRTGESRRRHCWMRGASGRTLTRRSTRSRRAFACWTWRAA